MLKKKKVSKILSIAVNLLPITRAIALRPLTTE
jgi:hypothetical protein